MKIETKISRALFLIGLPLRFFVWAVFFILGSLFGVFENDHDRQSFRDLLLRAPWSKP